MGKNSVPPFDPKEHEKLQKEIETQVKGIVGDQVPNPRGVDLHKDPHILRSVLHFAAMGFTHKKISEHTGLSPGAVQAMTRSESAKAEILRLQTQFIEQDFRKVFMRILPVAVNTAYGIMTNKKARDQVRLAASEQFMDRALGKPKQVVESNDNALAKVLEKLSGTTDLGAQNDEPIEAEFEKMAKDNASALDSINRNLGDEEPDEDEDEFGEDDEASFP